MEVSAAVQTILAVYGALTGVCALTWVLERRFLRRRRA